MKPKMVLLEDGLAGAGAVVTFRPGTWHSAGACQAPSVYAYHSKHRLCESDRVVHEGVCLAASHHDRGGWRVNANCELTPLRHSVVERACTLLTVRCSTNQARATVPAPTRLTGCRAGLLAGSAREVWRRPGVYVQQLARQRDGHLQSCLSERNSCLSSHAGTSSLGFAYCNQGGLADTRRLRLRRARSWLRCRAARQGKQSEEER